MAFGLDPYRGTNPSFIDAGGITDGPLLLNNDPQTTGVSLYQPLYGQQGAWTLTITKFNQQMQRNGQNGYDGGTPVKDDAASPWAFSFRVS